MRQNDLISYIQSFVTFTSTEFIIIIYSPESSEYIDSIIVRLIWREFEYIQCDRRRLLRNFIAFGNEGERVEKSNRTDSIVNVYKNHFVVSLQVWFVLLIAMKREA